MPRGKKNIPVSSTNDIEDKKIHTLTSNSIDTVESIKVETKEHSTRKSSPVIEKSRDSEKDTAPVILVSWTDAGGKRNTKTFTCAEVKIHEDRSETLQRTGKKTTLHISIDAQVLETNLL